MTADAFAEFRSAVLGDADLQDELLATEGRRAFVRRAVERAQALGFDVEAADVEAALRTSRETWNRRWV